MRIFASETESFEEAKGSHIIKRNESIKATRQEERGDMRIFASETESFEEAKGKGSRVIKINM